MRASTACNLALVVAAERNTGARRVASECAITCRTGDGFDDASVSSRARVAFRSDGAADAHSTYSGSVAIAAGAR